MTARRQFLKCGLLAETAQLEFRVRVINNHVGRPCWCVCLCYLNYAPLKRRVWQSIECQPVGAPHSYANRRWQGHIQHFNLGGGAWNEWPNATRFDAWRVRDRCSLVTYIVQFPTSLQATRFNSGRLYSFTVCNNVVYYCIMYINLVFCFTCRLCFIDQLTWIM